LNIAEIAGSIVILGLAVSQIWFFGQVDILEGEIERLDAAIDVLWENDVTNEHGSEE